VKGVNDMSTEITDKDIALDLLISSKATIATMVKVIIETSNSELSLRR
jgi:hypothetical protein